MKKFLKKILLASVVASTFIFNPPLANLNLISTVQAEVKTYTGVGECVQGDLMTEAQSKKLRKN